MMELVFVAGLAGALALVLRWAFRNLPEERWQMAAALPRTRLSSGGWSGTNLTWYGILVASSATGAVAIYLVLLGAVGTSPGQAALLILPTLAVGLPAARWIARLVEGKPFTFTIGGASLAGLVVVPWLALLLDLVPGIAMPPLPALAAVFVAFAFGEGAGRLACISFGCCYGRPLSEVPEPIRRFLAGRAFVFRGATKKIAYAAGLDGTPVVPIQAITSIVLIGGGLVGLSLFLAGAYGAALVWTAGATQGWRFLSELLRRDHRGSGLLSAYQWMALAAFTYVLAVSRLLPAAPAIRPAVLPGLAALWSPGVILGLQGLWLLLFLRTGRSDVTRSEIRFEVVPDRI